MARILVVDDSPSMIALLRVVLEERGHTVDEAGNGSRCLEKVRQGSYDLVVMDMMMPKMDGIETVRRLRETGCPAPIIAMSGGTRDFPAAFSLKMSEMHGANRLLFKPFENEEIIAAVEDLLATPVA